MDTIPIQSLSPSSSPPSRSSIRAVVTLSWPYSSSTRQCALLLADPDFRLRNQKGQVRVRFTGACAEAVAKSRAGIGDEVVLELEGARWEKVGDGVRTPGRSVEGELVFERRLGMRILGEGEERRMVVDATAEAERVEEDKVVETPRARIVQSLRSSLGGGGYSNGVPIYSSPAFVKRLRLSAESSNFFSDTVYDPFMDDEADDGKRKVRQRRSLGEVRQWRFAERTPSPVKATGLGLDGQMDVVDEDVAARDGVEHEKTAQRTDAAIVLDSSSSLASQVPQEVPDLDTGQRIVQSEESLPSNLGAGTEPALTLPSALPIGQQDSSQVTGAAQVAQIPTASGPIRTSAEPAQDQDAIYGDYTGPAQDTETQPAAFNQAHPSYESDTEEDEELYMRTPPRVTSPSPSQHKAARKTTVSSATAATFEETHTISTSNDPSPASRSGPASSSVAEKPAPQTRSTAISDATSLSHQTPAKRQVGGLKLSQTSAAATPLQSLGTTPQSEKDRVMSATYKSLFGFRTSPEAQPPPSKPVEMSTPTPKTTWSNMGRTTVDEFVLDTSITPLNVSKQRSPARPNDDPTFDEQGDISPKEERMPDASQRPPAFEATRPASPGGTTEADTEADEDHDQLEAPSQVGAQQDGTGFAPESLTNDLEPSHFSAEGSSPPHQISTTPTLLARDDSTTSGIGTAVVISSLPSASPKPSQQSQHVEVIDLGSISDAQEDIVMPTMNDVDDHSSLAEAEPEPVAMQRDVNDDDLMFAPESGMQDGTKGNIAEPSQAMHNHKSVSQGTSQVNDEEPTERASLPFLDDGLIGGPAAMEPSFDAQVDVADELVNPIMDVEPCQEQAEFGVQFEHGGIMLETQSADMLALNQPGQLQEQQESMGEEIAIAQPGPNLASFPGQSREVQSSSTAQTASDIVSSPLRDPDSKPVKRSDFGLLRFPAGRVVEDSQSEQAGTLPTQHTPEADNDEVEVVGVPHREPAANRTQDSEIGGEVPMLQETQTTDLGIERKPSPQPRYLQPSVIETGSWVPAETSPLQEPQPPMEQPPQEQIEPQEDSNGVAQDVLDDLAQPEQTATSPLTLPNDLSDDLENQENDVSSTAPVPSETPVTEPAKLHDTSMATGGNVSSTLQSEGPTSSVNETQAGSADRRTAPSTTEGIRMDLKPRIEVMQHQGTNSPEQFLHLPGGMVATFSTSALFPPSPLHSQPRHEGPNVTPWGETLQGDMFGDAPSSAFPSTPQLTQQAGSTTQVESSLRTSRAVSEVNEVVSNISTELSMEAQLEPEVQAHKQISDKWKASGQRTAAMLGLTREDTDEEMSNEPVQMDVDAQLASETNDASSELPKIGMRQNEGMQQVEPQHDLDNQIAGSANTHQEESTEHEVEARAAQVAEEESASAADARKTPSRKSLRARLSNVPDVISAWFSPRTTPTNSEAPNENTNGHIEKAAAASNDQVADVITPPRLTRGQSTGFTTSNGYFTPLANLERLLNPASQAGEVDVLAVVTDFTSSPQRAKGGPRDYFTVFKITDPSLEVSGSVRVEVFRPWKATLPDAQVGDVMLLRGFVVKSKKRQPYLLSAEGSAWCVWRYAELQSHASGSASHDGRVHVREEIHGPPVEFGDEERRMVKGLRRWFEETHPDTANGATNGHEDTDVHDGDEDAMAYRPTSPSVAARL